MTRIFTKIFMASILFFTAACGTEKTTSEKKRVVLVTPIPKGDPFISLVDNGLKEFVKENPEVEYTVVEAIEVAEQADQVPQLAEIGYDVIFLVWDDFGASLKEFAPKFPNQKFVVVDTVTDYQLPNVTSLNVSSIPPSFLAGVIAAKTTKTKKVGWIGHTDLPVVNAFRKGFEQGVAYQDPTVTISTAYIGSANDPAKGREMAISMAKSGVDVLMHSANQAGLGVIRGAEESKIKAIGVDSRQNSVSPVVFWSAPKDVGGAVKGIAEDVVLKNTFHSGIQEFDPTRIRLYFQEDYDLLSPEDQEVVKKAYDDLISGKIILKN